MTNNFLPNDYSVPVSGASKYMRFEDGENRFRVLSSAIVGWEYWTEEDGKRHPVRVRNESDLPNEVKNATESESRAKHFWAFVVYNVKAKDVQILEITQKSIMASVTALVQSDDWGDPKEYDILVNRSGEKLETTYSVVPTPKKPLDEGVMQFYKDLHINLEALYDGSDPFESQISDQEMDEIAKKVK
jgi:hypothetical protein